MAVNFDKIPRFRRTPLEMAKLHPIAPETARGRADLHIHTTHSDGLASVKQVLRHIAEKTCLSLIAITDHDVIQGSLEAARLASRYGIEAVIGEEISTMHGHLLGLFTERHIAPGASAWDTIAAIHAQGGLAIAPHPFDRSVPSIGVSDLAPYLGELGLDGFEGFNAGVCWPMRGRNLAAQKSALALRLPAIGGSDSHALPTIGKGFTTFAGHTADDLHHAIKTGRVGCGGQYWSLNDYLDPILQTVRGQGIRATASWIWRNAGQPGRIGPLVCEQRMLEPDMFLDFNRTNPCAVPATPQSVAW